MSEPGVERLLLVVDGGSAAPAELPQAGVLVVGASSARAGLVLAGTGVADVHCTIGRLKGGGWAIKDLGSSAGTLVNGKRVESTRLAAGDHVEIGSARLRVVDPTAPDATLQATRVAPPPDRSGDTQFVGAGARPAGPEPVVSNVPSITGYRIERAIGRGGMGSVHLAMQESLARPVALKFLSPRLAADREFVRRFQAEARAAAALNHPNVVTVYDVGEQGGTHYLSMEYMDRGTLEERVTKDGALPWREALDVLRDAAAGLVYAEARGIVHRDLKPANLMRNHVGATKIADLGLATHIEAEERESAEKKVFGTPHFMSPEQARGEKVDSRSDLYSLGATAYRLLTGHTPFEGKSSREIVRAHLLEEPRSMRELAPDLPEGVVTLVARLMRKDPAERYPSAADLLKELDRLRGAGGAPSGAVPSVDGATPAARSGAGGKLVLVVLLLALLGGAGFWIQKQKSSGPVDSALAGGNGRGPKPAPGPQPPTSGTTSSSDGAPAIPGAGPGDAHPTAPRDDDKALQLLEANARVAFLELLGKEMAPVERRDGLRALAEAWRGTTAAGEALEKADAIDAELAGKMAADAMRRTGMDAVLGKLAAVVAAGTEVKPPRPGATLLDMRAVAGQSAYEQDPEFQAKRRDLERTVVWGAAHYAREKLDEIGVDMSKGDFEAVKTKLTALMPVYDLPEFLPGQGPGGVDELYELGRTSRERLKNLELLHVTFVSQQSRDDRVALANGLGGASGFEKEVRALDLAAARARLVALGKTLGSKESQAFVKGLQEDVERGDAVLQTLGREFASWRRKAFTDPRPGKGQVRNAAGADASGLLFENEAGETEHLPWSVFGGDDRELSKLFTERLTREWTQDEVKAIAGLMRLTAVSEATAIVAKMFDPSRRSNFTDGDARALADCFAQAQVWAQRAGTPEVIARENEAARLLSQVLQKATEGVWSIAVAGIEELLSKYDDTLLVKLLSDGTIPPSATAPPVPPVAPDGAPPKPPDKPKDG